MAALRVKQPDTDGKIVQMSFWRRLRAYFFAGILITMPIVVTIALAWWFIGFVDSKIVPLVPVSWNPNTYLVKYFGIEIGLPGVGLVVLVIAITLVGFLTANFLGRFFVRLGENIVNRMPVIRSIYGASKQILETVMRDQSTAFRQAVLVEYPRRGIWAVGFVTGTTEGEVQNLTKEEVVNIFLPTTPNPTSGFLLFIPTKDLVPLDMTVEEAVKMVISGGLVTPPDRRPQSEREVPVVSAATWEEPDIEREKKGRRRLVTQSED